MGNVLTTLRQKESAVHLNMLNCALSPKCTKEKETKIADGLQRKTKIKLQTFNIIQHCHWERHIFSAGQQTGNFQQ